MRLTVLLFLTCSLAYAQKPAPPTRTPDMPGFVTAKELPGGTLPPATETGNFILGPTHAPAPDTLPRPGIPHGIVSEFVLNSADSKFYPGIARDPGTFGKPDPHDPAKLVVTTSHPAPYSPRVTVYIPRQYVAGTIAPFLVGADGPDPLLSPLWTTSLLTIASRDGRYFYY